MASKLQNFSTEEILILHEIPFWVFYQVAGADSVIDEQEVNVFKNMLNDAPQLRDPFAREVFMSMRDDFENALLATRESSSQSMTGMTRAMEILSRKSTPEDCAEFKQLVFVMGWSVASASGDPHAPTANPDSNISTEEIKNLSGIADVLGLNMTKLRRVITSSDGDKVWKSFLVDQE